jgi:hypothetical protein
LRYNLITADCAATLRKNEPMNTITAALKNAGVPVPPLAKRIWLWLKDHPNKTSREVSTALNAVHSQVATLTNQMYKRGMLEKITGGDMLRWKTCIPEYERLPIRKASAPIAKATCITVPPNFPKVLANAVDIEALTLREARALYNQLKEYFA